jgi:PAS domain S-box-containing protein
VAATFITDVLLPPAIATGVIYAATILLGLWLPSITAILLLAAATTLAAVLGFLAAPGPPLPEGWPLLVNRGLAVAAVWAVTLLVVRQRISIEALRRGEADLREREARLRAILATAPEAIVVIDARGTVESFSPSAEALFGYRAAEVVGGNVRQLMPPPDREAHDGYLARYLRTGERRVIGAGRVVKGRRKDGSVFPLELAVGEVAADGGPHFVGFIRDLTARERMEGELRQAQKMEAVGQFTGGIAHDFNNLLTVVLGNLEMLEDRLGGREPHLLLLREAKTAVRSGAELTGRLLAFARRQPLDPKPVDLRRQLGEAAALLRRTLGETIEVRTSAPDGLAPALADAGQLQNAVLNLALNARDAMPRGGVLVLGAAAAEVDAGHAAAHADGVRPGRYLVLSVTDTGAGMPAEVRERAFEPFFTTKEVGAGSGLGLSMVYGFAKQSGGHAQIHSEPGRGTTVRLYLPQAERAAQEAATPPLPPPPPPATFPGRGETILVAEDDELVRRYVVARLEGLGYRVLEAEDGPAALRLLEAPGRAVDLLFTDVVMPGGMTGIDLAELALRRWPELRVVFTSAYAEPELVQRGLAEGSQWLRKPHTALDLARTLRRVLDRPADSPAPDRPPPPRHADGDAAPEDPMPRSVGNGMLLDRLPNNV